MKLKEGDKAPDFTAPDENGEELTLSNLKGQWVVLYFYPKDNTPGCTIEAIDFTKLLPKFAELECTVIGISKDSCASHKKFVTGKNLKVKLISDESTTIQKNYDVWGKKKFMGKEFMGTKRTTFLIDPKMTIRKIWEDVSAKGHAQEVLEELRNLSNK